MTTINARAETVAEKPLYRAPFKKHRCLVPASGFYEWQKRDSYKQPFAFTVKDRPMFFFAGLYDVWHDSKREEHKSLTIITTKANHLMSDVHERMPVILERNEEALWLDESQDSDHLLLMLDPFNDTEMTGYEVSREVGNVKNNSSALLEPIAT